MTVATGETLGAYALRGAVGVGGMGVVHDAVDVRAGTRVAVKVLRGELSEDATYARRFEREIAVASELRHPNLLPVVDAGEEGGRRYLVMEYAEDGTLADRLEAGRCRWARSSASRRRSGAPSTRSRPRSSCTAT